MIGILTELSVCFVGELEVFVSWREVEIGETDVCVDRDGRGQLLAPRVTFCDIYQWQTPVDVLPS